MRGIHSYTYLGTWYVHTEYKYEARYRKHSSQQCCLQRLQQLRASSFPTNRVQATHFLEKLQSGWYCRESKNSTMACGNYLYWALDPLAINLASKSTVLRFSSTVAYKAAKYETGPLRLLQASVFLRAIEAYCNPRRQIEHWKTRASLRVFGTVALCA